MKQILFLLMFILCGDLIAATPIPASAKEIDYVGRIEKMDDGAVRYDWVGVHLRTRFTGDYCAVRVSDSKSSFHEVFVDGKFMGTINTKGRDTTIVLCNKIGGGMHDLLLFKRSEASEGATTIHDITLADGARLFKPQGTPQRRIEFIGNSITCGFGVESTDPNEEYSPEAENAYYSFASLAARRFNADAMLTAHSGQGVVRNYGDNKQLSDITMRHRFLNLYDDAKQNKPWTFDWKPDLVVINLGTNDFSSQEFSPSMKQFVAGYKELVASVRKVYGNIPILCMSSPMFSDSQWNGVVESCHALSNDPKVFFVPIYRHILNYPADIGCGHPNRKGQQKVEMVLATYISSIMGWEL